MIKEAIIKLVNKGDLTCNEAKEVMLEIMGENHPHPECGFPGSPFHQEHQGGNHRRNFRLCGSHAVPGHARAPSGDGSDGNRGDRRGRRPFLQHFHDFRHGAGRRRGEGGQAREQGCFFPVRYCGLSGSPGGKHPAGSGPGPEDAAGNQFLLPVRPEIPCGHEVCGAHPEGTGVPDGVQHPGPLTNPAKPEMFLLGVYDGYLVEPLAKVLCSLGVKRGLVAYGQEKLDEISPTGPPPSVNSGTGTTGLR